MIRLGYLVISLASGLVSLICFVGTVAAILDSGTIQAIDALVGGIVFGTASAAASVLTFHKARKK